jgi:hypothetical protein
MKYICEWQQCGDQRGYPKLGYSWSAIARNFAGGFDAVVLRLWLSNRRKAINLVTYLNDAREGDCMIIARRRAAYHDGERARDTDAAVARRPRSMSGSSVRAPRGRCRGRVTPALLLPPGVATAARRNCFCIPPASGVYDDRVECGAGRLGGPERPVRDLNGGYGFGWSRWSCLDSSRHLLWTRAVQHRLMQRVPATAIIALCAIEPGRSATRGQDCGRRLPARPRRQRLVASAQPRRRAFTSPPREESTSTRSHCRFDELRRRLGPTSTFCDRVMEARVGRVVAHRDAHQMGTCRMGSDAIHCLR